MNTSTSHVEQLKFGGYVFRQPIEHTQQLEDVLLDFYSRIDYPYRRVEIPFDDPLRSEVRRFLLSLDAYIESPYPAIPEKFILYGSAKKDFATTLKRIKRKSIETSWAVENFSLPDWWKETPRYQIFDIGQIFNYSYLIFFKEEVTDYLEGFVPLNQEEEVLIDFRETVALILSTVENLEKIDEREVLNDLSASKAYVDGLSQRHFRNKHRYLTFAKDRGGVLRAQIPVSPGNIRDSVINQIDDLNTISLIEKQTLELLKQLRGHIHLKDRNRIDHRLKNLRKYSYFLHRDLKKEGITKPRNLLRIMLEELHKCFPDIKAYENTTFYDNFSVLVDGKMLYPQRGHGLGMANALTTLMQIAVHYMTLSAASIVSSDMDCKFLCLNDDFVCGFLSSEDAESYWDEEYEILDGLGLIRSPEKSFIAKDAFVICERYFSLQEHRKESYLRREQLLPLACYNIVHAKEYVMSSGLKNPYIEEIVAFWGYEFFQKEKIYPYICGGWSKSSYEGVSLDLNVLENLPYNSDVVAGYNATRARIKKKDNDKLIIPPLLKILGVVPPDHFDEYSLFSYEEREFHFLRFTDVRSFKSYWDKLAKKRHRLFIRESIPFNDFILRIVTDHPKEDFYPIDIMIDHYVEGRQFIARVRDPYQARNPLLAYLSAKGLIDFEEKDEFSINFVDPDTHIRGTRDLLPKDLQRSKHAELSTYVDVYANNMFLWNEELQDSYLSPLRLALMLSAEEVYKIPILKLTFISPLIKLKREIFGRFLTIEEMIVITEENYTRSQITSNLEHLLDEKEEELHPPKVYEEHSEDEKPPLLDPRNMVIVSDEEEPAVVEEKQYDSDDNLTSSVDSDDIIEVVTNFEEDKDEVSDWEDVDSDESDEIPIVSVPVVPKPVEPPPPKTVFTKADLAIDGLPSISPFLKTGKYDDPRTALAVLDIANALKKADQGLLTPVMLDRIISNFRLFKYLDEKTIANIRCYLNNAITKRLDAIRTGSVFSPTGT